MPVLKYLTVIFVLLSPLSALADEVSKPDLVLLPRDVAMAALNWLAEPNAGIAVKLYAALQACIQDNPNKGVVTRNGADQCPNVTEAIAVHEKELEALRKEIADLKTSAQKAK